MTAAYEYAAATCVDGLTSAKAEELSLAKMRRRTREAREKELINKLGKKPSKDAVAAAKAQAAQEASQLSIADWRRSVIDKLGSAKQGDYAGYSIGKGKNRTKVTLTEGQANAMNAASQALGPDKAGNLKWQSSAQLEQLLNGTLPGATNQFTADKYSSRRRPMFGYLGTKGLIYDPDWQPETSVSYVQTTKAADGTIVKKRYYPDPLTVPYVVRRPGIFTPTFGSFVKVTNPAAGGGSTYARVLEGGPKDKHGAEASLKTLEAIAAPGQSVSPTGTSIGDITFKPIGRPPAYEGGYKVGVDDLNNEEIQLAGWLIDKKGVNHIGTHDQLKDAIAKVGKEAEDKAKALGLDPKNPGKAAAAAPAAPAAAQQPAAGPLLLTGFPTVAIGPELNCAGYADITCEHEAGGSVAEGAWGIFLGDSPMARVGDKTTDQLNVKTGNTQVQVFGPPSSAKLQKEPPVPKAIPLDILRRGESSEQVKIVQRKLGVSPTGLFGTKTQAAVRAFQKANNLRVDGVVGEKTWGALLR